MITKIENLTTNELEEILTIWLAANQEAHPFIPSAYWQDHFAEVKEALPLAELYVHRDKDKITGFVGISETYIAGIFVQHDYRNQGIGQELLNESKNAHSTLTLSVYAKNQPAYNFYLKHGFQLVNEQLDDTTGELEYQLIWEK